jgi:hypothetical protein
MGGRGEGSASGNEGGEKGRQEGIVNLGQKGIIRSCRLF